MDETGSAAVAQQVEWPLGTGRFPVRPLPFSGRLTCNRTHAATTDSVVNFNPFGEMLNGPCYIDAGGKEKVIKDNVTDLMNAEILWF